MAGLGISTYLAWTALNMAEVYGCGGSELFDCSHVLKSKWSKVFGLPVSLPAGALYATMLALLAFARKTGPRNVVRPLWNLITAGGLMAGFAAIWFIGLQIFVIKHLCPYCLAVHSCGLILSGLILSGRQMSLGQKSLMGSAAAGAVAVLAAVQVTTPEQDNFEVVRYDDVASADAAVSDDAEFVAAPGDMFEAPGDLFEAPGGDVFEAPGADSQPVESTEAVKADGVQPVAATLLLLMPPRILQLAPLFVVDEPGAATGTPASQDNASPAQPAAQNPEPAKAAAPANPPQNPRRLVTVAGNRVTLDAKQWPLLGKSDAKYIFVEMYDYTCPHCRNTHHAIKGALDQFGDQLAIVVLPVPLDASCNDAASGGGHAGACELAKIAVTVWRVAPSRFREFHDWMFENHATPTTARSKAEQLVGADKFRKEYSSKTPAEYVRRHVELYKKVGRGSVPKLMFPNSTLNGEVNNKATLCSTIERELVAVQPAAVQ